MNDQTLGRLEAEAGEILRTAKELFGEFERRLGEAVSAQRLANSEARNEAAEVLKWSPVDGPLRDGLNPPVGGLYGTSGSWTIYSRL